MSEPRPLPVLRHVEVVGVERLTRRLVAVQLQGDDLDGFRIPAATSHIKVVLPANGDTVALPESKAWPPANGPRPLTRTYTPRRFDAAGNTLEVQFLVHGEGPGSDWADRAAAGDRLAVVGPGGSFPAEPDGGSWWVAGDESAVPAIATMLDALPTSANVDVHIEVTDGDDEMPLPSRARTAITWHHRRNGGYGAALATAARESAILGGANVWVACEAAAMRGIRRYLLAERQIPADSLICRGYWRVGMTDYPDKDYGEGPLATR